MKNISDHIGWHKTTREGIVAGLILGSFFFMFSAACILVVGMLAVAIIVAGVAVGVGIAVRTKNPGNIYWALAPMGTILAYLLLMATSGVL